MVRPDALLLLTAAATTSEALTAHPPLMRMSSLPRRAAWRISGQPMLADEGSETSEEIAALEAKLKALKIAEAEKDALRARDAAAYEAENALSGDEVKEFDPTTLSFRKKVANTRVAPPSELLSESWKESDDKEAASEGGGGMGIVGPVIGILGLIAFSFVPIGNVDIEVGEQRVAVESTAAIRERYSVVQSGADESGE